MKSLLLLVFLLVMAVANGQQGNDLKNKIPAAVQKAFDSQYSAAQHPQWQHLGNHWQVTFSDANGSGKNQEILYNENGDKLESHMPLNKDQAPAAITSYLQHQYPSTDYTIEKIIKPASPVVYAVSLDLSSGRKTFYLDENASLIGPLQKNP